MAFLIFGFSEGYQNDILRGRKTATIFEGFEPVAVGHEYPVCVSKGGDIRDGGNIFIVGTAMVDKVIQKRAGYITEDEAKKCGHELREELMRFLSGQYDMGDLSPVTFVEFDLCLDIDAVRKFVGGPEVGFIVSDDNISVLHRAAHEIHRRQEIDTYYDKAELALAVKDQWLRHRGDTGWQLKLPTGSGGYKLVTDPNVIKGILDVSDLDVITLLKAGYGQLASIVSWKTVHRMGDFLVRTDIIDQNDLKYRVGRVSSLIHAPFYELEPKMMDFAETNGFAVGGSRSPIVEFIRVNRPEEFLKLKAGGVFK